MARKRLGDLLRQEVQQDPAVPPPLADVPPATTAPTASESPDAAIATVMEGGATAESGLAPSRSRRGVPTKADLEATIADLTQALATSQQEADQLCAQIATLQAQLEAQSQQVQIQIKQLEQAQVQAQASQKEYQQERQREHQQTQQIQKELAEAKALILQLSAANTQPQAEITQLKQPPPPARVSARDIAVRPPLTRPALTRPWDTPKPLPAYVVRSENLPANQPSNQPSQQPGRLSDADIGWVD